MSPRAAWRLESLGFSQVYDYAAGKLDWMAAGLATEGTGAAQPRGGGLARRDVPTCGLGDPLGEVAGRVRAQGWDACVVLNGEQVVLGLLRAAELAGDPSRTAEQAMRPGPSTFRPHRRAAELARVMQERRLPNVCITTSDGKLVGLVRRGDAAAALADGPPSRDPGDG
ncbi:MAG TPA: CBS domain-containing protein [Actinomycetota bacterium]|nr:CBS domain-containing protein [Actinomycetota bacterium]